MTAPARKLPALTPETAPFWTGGEHGTLLIQRSALPPLEGSEVYGFVATDGD